MNSMLLGALALLLFLFGYFVYAKFIGEKIYGLDPNRRTPAHEFEDGVDFVPTNKYVLYGHHYATIAGAGPIVGPAIAVIYGWLPAILWAVLGTIFIGAVHDFGALAASLRHQGRSIGDICKDLVGPRARWLFLWVIFFLLLLAIAVFARIIGTLFKTYPSSVLPAFGLIFIAVMVGYAIYRTNLGLGTSTAVAVLLFLFLIWLGIKAPIGQQISINQWIVVLLFYGFWASSLPVWILLQPRDYINSFQLYIALALFYLGLFVMRPDIVAPAVRTDVPGAPPLIPFIFILIACGAVSGFHALASSGTTSKQIDNERDARFVGYAGMLGEGLISTIAVIATTSVALGSAAVWQEHYATFGPASGLGAALGAFVEGTGHMMAAIGFSPEFSKNFVAVTVIGFALTTLDSACRILRYIIAEMGAGAGLKVVQNRWVASFLAVFLAYLLATVKVGETPTGLVLWPLFGTTNQVLAALTFLTVSIWLLKRNRPTFFTMAPMAFMLVVTTWAMLIQLEKFYTTRTWLLFVMGLAILFCVLWVVVESLTAFFSFKRAVKARAVQYLE